MGSSASRLTLYAILGAMEADLRATINSHLTPEENAEFILGEELYGRAVERYGKDNPSPHNPATGLGLVDLLSYIDFADAHAVLNKNSAILPKALASDLKRWTPRMERLAAVRNRVAHGRPLQFDDFARTLDTVHELLSTHSISWSELRLILEKIKNDPSFVLGIKLPRDNTSPAVRHNLPAPDFDETGFLGRSKEVADLTKHCLGPYPVVTIVGDGGLGKTALALKIAYDLLDFAPQQFDAIVWSSSKTTRLTAQEIIRIENAISTSLGLLQNIATELGGDQSQPIEDILDLLKDFRILLILDNLETVIDERVRLLLEKLPKGSKVLITSRIGLGAFELPYKLQPLESGEAIQLLRALITSRDVKGLQKLSNAKLGHYCQRMHNSPGYIKWFVTAVQSGRRPEEILAKPTLFLDFCLSNVYGYLSEDSRLVLKSMLCIPLASSQAELAFLTELDSLVLQRALQQLMTTNMITMTSVVAGSSFESRYAISDLPREYLLRHHRSVRRTTGYSRRDTIGS
jgi:LuxR family glucitol operon transcriptional activator